MLTAFLTWLKSLGDVAFVLPALVPVALYMLRKKFGPLVTPVTPTPDPTPATVSPRLDAIAPFINALLTALGIAPKGRAATVADIPHDFHLQLRNEVDRINGIKAAATTTAAKDLLAWDEPVAK